MIPKLSPCPVSGGVAHVQDLLDRHQVGGNDGVEVGVRRLLAAAVKRRQRGRLVWEPLLHVIK